ncbi:MAG: repeat protein, partial [Streptosporangiaceae bacterium]|nr:repeat protein [Streptosporangiaceae bacterium]
PGPPLQLPPIRLGNLHRPHVRGHEKWSTRARHDLKKHRDGALDGQTGADRRVIAPPALTGAPAWSVSVGLWDQFVTPSIAVSADSRFVAAACLREPGTQTFAVTGGGKVRALAFQPGHPLLATANENGSVVIIDAATAAEHGCIQRLLGCSQLAFVPGGMLLAAAWDDNTVSIHDVTTPGSPPKL